MPSRPADYPPWLASLGHAQILERHTARPSARREVPTLAMSRDQSTSLVGRTGGPRLATPAVRLLLLNAQHAGPLRARRQVAWLSQLSEADVVVITEVGSGPGGRALVAALAEHGYHQVHAPTADPPDLTALVAARGAIRLEPVPSGVGFLPHRSPAADLFLGGHKVRLLGLYVPSRGPAERRNEAKRAFQRAVSQALPRLIGGFDGPAVVAGDLNVVEPGHVPHYRVYGSWEYDFYRSFLSAGLTDAYRALHPSTVEHSWYGRAGNGYRFDHIFTTANALAVTSCEYLHQTRTDGISDHAALRLTAAITVPTG